MSKPQSTTKASAKGPVGLTVEGHVPAAHQNPASGPADQMAEGQRLATNPSQSVVVGRTTRGRDPLTRERIARAALTLIDDEGLEGFSVRGLGQRLGIEAMSLYHHFPNKDAILDAVMEILVDEVPIELEVPSNSGEADATGFREEAAGEWRDTVRKLAYDLRDTALRHPRAYSLLITRPYTTDRTLRFCDDLIRIIRGSGCDDLTAARAFRVFGYFIDGAAMYITQGPARKVGDPVPPPVPIDPTRFPNLSAVGPYLSRANAGAHFDFAVERILETIEGIVAESKR
jgi:AcrR family transcriptional regulator